jgi:hypothetical protein
MSRENFYRTPVVVPRLAMECCFRLVVICGRGRMQAVQLCMGFLEGHASFFIMDGIDGNEDSDIPF